MINQDEVKQNWGKHENWCYKINSNGNSKCNCGADVLQDEVREELKEIRHRWRGFAVVDNSFEDLGVSQNADRIADFFLSEFAAILAKKESEPKLAD